MKISKIILLCLAVMSSVFFNSCKDDSKDTSDNPWVDTDHQVHSSYGYSITFPANVFGQYHHDRDTDLLDTKDVKWDDVMNVFCLKVDSASNITIATTSNNVSQELVDKHEAFEIEVISAPNNLNLEPLTEDVYFSSLDQHVNGHFFFEDVRNMQFYYLFNPINKRGYRIVVQAPASNTTFWGYVPEILASFKFVEE